MVLTSRRPIQSAVLAAALLGSVPTLAGAQENSPTARATRIEEPPVIDGSLSDAVWSSGEAITSFRQRDPDEGAPATEPTSVWILYDESNLYIGARLDDGEPGRIQASELRRDNDLDSDDTFAVILDTYRDRRNGFLFRVNPKGTRFDAVVRNEGQPDEDWTEEWRAEAAIGPTGWTVEIAIPFKSLRFNLSNNDVWGVNLQRVIRRKNEDAYWTNWSRDFDFEHVSQAGALGGLERIRQGNRIRLQPYVVGGVESLDAANPSQPSSAIGEIGIDDLKIAVTPNMTADIAVNPDFAQTEIDEQRVNLTRFSLFFPEKRQFFLEGAESFRLGPPGGEFGEDEALELFHSRRIGLSERGMPIPLVAGGKMTGKVRGVDLGVMAARTGEEDGVPGETFGVMRFRREMFGRSYIGAIATVRDGAETTNGTLGVDARFVLQRQLTLSALAARTDTGSGDAQWASYVGAEWDGDFLSAGAMHMDIDPEFDPGIGFVRRNDRMTKGGFSLGPRPSGGPIRQIEFGPEFLVHHDHDGELLTRELGFDVETSFQSGESLEFSVKNIREDLPEPFEIEDGIELPTGRYEWNTVELSVNSYEGRKITAEASFEAGGFYNGTARSLELSSGIRMGPHLTLGPEYEMNRVNLAEGRFTTHLVGLRTDLAFTRDLLTSALFQYNSEGELAALQVRFNYIFRNIDNFYLVYNETRFTDGPFRNRSNRSLVTKLTYSLRR